MRFCIRRKVRYGFADIQYAGDLDMSEIGFNSTLVGAGTEPA
jgi:hypothetical protein